MKIINDQSIQKFTAIPLIILFFLVNQIYCQGWQTTLPYETGSCNFETGVASSLDGGYVMFSNFTDETNENSGMKISKIDADGVIVWSKTITQNSYYFLAKDIKACTDGGFIIGGGEYDPFSLTGNGYSCKIDASGNLLWEYKTISSDVIFFDGVEETIDGGYILAGSSLDTATNSHNLYLEKLDGQGNQVWTSSPQGLFVRNLDVTVNTDSTIMIVGTSTIGTNYGGKFFKLDPSGNLIWQKSFNSNSTWGVFLNSIDKTTNGYILGGILDTTSKDIWLIQTDLDGNVVWDKTISSVNIEALNDIKTTPDQGYIIAASNVSNSNAIAIKTDSLGTIEWRKDIPNNYKFFSVDLAQDGGYVMSGIGKISSSITPIHVTFNSSTIDIDFEITSLAECGSYSSGTITATPLNTPPPYDFSWFNGAIGPTITPMQGWHYLTVTDGNGVPHPAKVFVPSTGKAELVKFDSEGALHSNYVSGNVLNDINDNCIIDQGDTPLRNWMIQLTGDDEYFTLSDSLGNYSFELDSGAYNISTIHPSALFDPCQPLYPVNLTNFDSLNLDIPIKSIVDCPIMTVNVGVIGMRRCMNPRIYIYYCNEGTVDATDVYVEVTLDTAFTFVSCPIPWTNLGGNTYSFDIGNVPYNSCNKFEILTNLSCNTTIGQAHCIEAHIFPDSLCVPPQAIWDGSITDLGVNCAPDSITFTITNIGQSGMNTSQDYIIVEDNVILKTDQYQLTPSDDFKLKVPSNGSTYRMYAEQAIGYFPSDYVPTVAIEGCGTNAFGTFSQGFINAYANTNNLDYSITRCIEVTGPFDPNDKRAQPTGYGAAHYIEQNIDLDYHIRFQNIGNDTAFNVVIRDTLSEHLNMATIKPGAASHPYQLDIIGNNILKFTFPNIELVDSTTNEPDSHGFIQFNIEQHEDLPLGTMIYNSAAIYFDYEAPVITNQTYHEIGENFIALLSSVNESEKYPNLAVKIYPNPFSQYADFVVENASNQTKMFSVIDIMGRTLTTTSFEGNHLRLQRKDLPAGTYFFTIKEHQQVLSTGRFMVH